MKFLRLRCFQKKTTLWAKVDLNIIVRTALEKYREDRYESFNKNETELFRRSSLYHFINNVTTEVVQHLQE